jgi:GxxExxY protein
MRNGRHLNDPETYAIIGAAMAVHSELGCGFLEAVYKASLAIELRRRTIPFEREVALPILYKGELLPLSYRVDFICAHAVIVEVKAHEALADVDLAQAINYLRAARLERGLLLNFGGSSLEHRRVVWGRIGSGSASGGGSAAALGPETDARAARDEEATGFDAERHWLEDWRYHRADPAEGSDRRAPRSLRWTPRRSSRPGGPS